MDDMDETDWDTALAKLGTTDESRDAQADHLQSLVAGIAADWMRILDSADPDSRRIEDEEFETISGAVGAGIILGMFGAFSTTGQDMTIVNKALQNLREE